MSNVNALRQMKNKSINGNVVLKNPKINRLNNNEQSQYEFQEEENQQIKQLNPNQIKKIQDKRANYQQYGKKSNHEEIYAKNEREKDVFSNINDVFIEEHKIIRILWFDLGVTDNYKYLFEAIASEMNHKERLDFFEIESHSLKKIHETLKKIVKEVKTRNKLIFLLKKFSEILNESEINSKMANDILFAFRNLRTISITIVNLYCSIRNILHFESSKFDFDKLNTAKYEIDKHYLTKMREDTNFLKDSSLSRYFNFSVENDTFLLSLSEESNKETVNKFNLPINEEMLFTIKSCQYEIINETIYSELDRSRIKNKFNVVLPTKKNLEEMKMKKSNSKNLENKYQRNIHNEINRKITIDVIENRKDSLNMEREIQKLKEEFSDKILKEKQDIQLNKKDPAFSNDVNEIDSPKRKTHISKLVIEEKNLESKSQPPELCRPKEEIFMIENYAFNYCRNSKILENEYNTLFSNANGSQKKIFNSIEKLNIYEGVFPKCIQIQQDMKTIGYVFYYYDSLSSNTLKLIIRNIITSVQNDKLEKFLSLVKEFFVRNVLFDELIISLYYSKNNENNFEINQEIVDIYKKKLLFKWIKLENTGTERIMKLSCNMNQQGKNESLNNYLNKSILNLRIQQSTVFQLEKKQLKSENKSNNTKDTNSFPLIHCLLEGINSEEKSFDVELTRKFKISECNYKEIKSCCSSFSYCLAGSSDIVFENFSQNKIQEFHRTNYNNESKLQSNYMNFMRIVDNITSTVVKIDKIDYIYNVIYSDKIDVLVDSTTRNQYYLIKIDDNNTMIIFENRKELMNRNISEYFNEIYPNLVPDEKTIKQRIFIPSFSKSITNFSETLDLFNDINVKKEDEIHKITNISQNYDINFDSDEFHEKSLKSEVSKDDVLIDKCFFFGIINFEILSELNLPTIFSCVIDKSDWKINK